MPICLRAAERTAAADLLRRQPANPPYLQATLQPIASEDQRDTRRFGVQGNYGWSEDKARQVSRPQRADFGRYLREHGFRLD